MRPCRAGLREHKEFVKSAALFTLKIKNREEEISNSNREEEKDGDKSQLNWVRKSAASFTLVWLHQNTSFFFFFWAWLLYNVVLVSSVLQNESAVHMTHPLFFRSCSHWSHHGALSRAPSTVGSLTSFVLEQTSVHPSGLVLQIGSVDTFLNLLSVSGSLACFCAILYACWGDDPELYVPVTCVRVYYPLQLPEARWHCLAYTQLPNQILGGFVLIWHLLNLTSSFWQAPDASVASELRDGLYSQDKWQVT